MFNKKRGFTLIELLVVIAIIGLLASIVMISLNSARNKAKYGKAKAELDQIRKAMIMYKGDVGELPPRGDSCPICGWPAGASGWGNTINALMSNDGSGWDGPYLSARLERDPWGSYYTYDDNDCNSNCGNSSIRTVGPDGVPGGDDYILRVTSLDELDDCVTPCY